MTGFCIAFLIGQMWCSCPFPFGEIHNAIECVPKESDDETLLHSPLSIGLYGGPIVMFSKLNDDFACLVGGKGGLMFNHMFVIGGGGYGLVNEIDAPPVYPSPDLLLDFGYGGVFFEFVLGSHKIVHLSMNALIGGGGAQYRTPYYDYWDDDAFFVFEPGADLELNVSHHFRIGLGGTYRLIQGIGLTGLSDQDLSGPSGVLTFKFGHF